MTYARYSALLHFIAMLALLTCVGGCRFDLCRSPEGHRQHLQENWKVLHEIVEMWREDALKGMNALWECSECKPHMDDGGIPPPPDRVERYKALMRQADVDSLRGSPEYLEFSLFYAGWKRHYPAITDYRCVVFSCS